MKLEKYTDLISSVTNEHAFDNLRIIKILADRGYICDSEQAEELWGNYSDSMAAGWMNLPPEDERVFKCIEPYID